MPPPRRGEVWSVWTPGQPDDPHQPRPAVIVSSNARNFNTDDVIVVPIFSEGALGPTHVLLPSGAAGIDHDSMVWCEEVTTIDREWLENGPVGTVPDEILRAVVIGIRRAVGDVVPP